MKKAFTTHHKRRRKGLVSRRWKSLLLIGVAVVVLALIVADMVYPSKDVNEEPVSSQNELAKGAKSYGIAFSNTLSPLDQKQRTALLKKIKTDGFQEVRYALLWEDIEPQKDTYDWKKADAIVKVVRSSGLRSVITLDTTPRWARQVACQNDAACAPANAADFAEFAGKVAERYKGNDISAWEIWNEPNIVNFWKPAPSPTQYTELLKQTYASMKKSDSNATVIVGGLAGNSVDSNGVGYVDPRTFLETIYTNGGFGNFDGIAYHPYTGLQLPSTPGKYNGWLKMDTGEKNIRLLMTQSGDADKKLWLTEYGVPTDGPGTAFSDLSKVSTEGNDHVTLEAENQIAQEAIHYVKDKPWIHSLDWFTYKDAGTKPVDAGMFYGLLDAQDRPKPAYETLRQAAKQ